MPSMALKREPVLLVPVATACGRAVARPSRPNIERAKGNFIFGSAEDVKAKEYEEQT
jgi:hypothetical protein